MAGVGMNREELLLSMFDSSGFGLEVGPSFRPLLPKSRYNVETIDHADATTLRKKYSDNASLIEEVDYVSDGGSMLDKIGQSERYDFILASHVIEHVPDLVGFLQDCETLLKPAGQVILAVPDKRYCFDVLRPISTVGQVLQAKIESRDRHTIGTLYDQDAYACAKSGDIAWMEPDMENIGLLRTPEMAKKVLDADSDTYRDAHGWQFTPTSFRYIIKTLNVLGFIGLGETNFYKYNSFHQWTHEFYVCLTKQAPPITNDDLTLLKEVEKELRETTVSADHAGPPSDSASLMTAAQNRIAQLEHINSALLNSTSWRIAAPLRSLKNMLTRLRPPQAP